MAGSDLIIFILFSDTFGTLSPIFCGRRIEDVPISDGSVSSRIMELTLNLVWAMIAAASYALLFRRLSNCDAGNARGLSRGQCIVALTCFLAILFPVISLTDDLHQMQATAEEASPSGLIMKRCVASGSSTGAQTLHCFLLLYAPLAANPRWADFAIMTAREIQRTSPGMHLSAFGRAPPSFAIPRIS